VYIALGVTSA